jgi:CheY-like chemotaxis protein
LARILLIDDEQEWLDLCREHLESLGHQVEAVNCGADALTMTDFDPPDAVVLDVLMPIGGRMVLRTLRGCWPHVPVVVHTAHGRPDDPGLAAADAFVVKSTNLTKLAAAVEQLTRGKVQPAGTNGWD